MPSLAALVKVAGGVFSLGVALAAESPRQACEAGSGTCSSNAKVLAGSDHILLQQEIKEHVRKARVAGKASKPHVTSDCAQQLQDFAPQGGAACVVVRDNAVLLVKVPYGSQPGWDLPGGKGDKGHEAACETAERETCEETRHQVRAVAKLSSNVFACEIIKENVCTQAVDEGFLPQGWFAASDIHTLDFRGWTWGDKQGMIKRELASNFDPSVSAGVDECGCRRGVEGWSSTRNRCYKDSVTDGNEAQRCAQR